MSEYLRKFEIDPDKIECSEDLSNKLCAYEITNGLVRDLALAAKKLDGSYVNTVLKWLEILANEDVKNEFTLEKEGAIKMKLEKVIKTSKKLHSTRRREFLNERFIPEHQVQINTQTVDTPKKVRLKRKNEYLVMEKREMFSKVKCLESELANAEFRKEQLVNQAGTLSTELKDKGTEFLSKIQSLSEKNKKLSADKLVLSESKITLQKKFAATRKHFLGSKKKLKETATVTRPSPPDASLHCTKSVGTCLKGTGKPLVKLLSRTSSDLIFVGEEYPGSDTVASRMHSGSRKYFAEIPIRRMNNDPSRQELWRRARDGVTMLNFVSAADGFQSDEKLKGILVGMMRLKPDVFAEALEEAKICTTKMITPSVAVNVQSLLRLTDNKMRELRLMLKNAGTHVIPSERQMQKIKGKKTEHVSLEKLETGEMYLKRMQKDEQVSSCPYVKVKDLIEFVTAIVTKADLVEDPMFNNEIWLLFSGDKGGNSMKYVFSVVNDTKNGSVDNNHIFCLFQASDCLENMWKIFSPYISQLKKMQSPDFLMTGKKVRIFLGGDYHFIDGMLGHGGSSSSFPSSADFVSLNHLRNHGGQKHSIASCKIDLRTVKWYQTYYSENCFDLRNKGAMNENAKFHFSVIEKMLFPIHDLDNVVPAVLHIFLGITLRLFNKVESELIKLDGKCKTVDEINTRAMLQGQLSEKEKEFQDLQSKLRKTSEKLIELENTMSRFQAVASGNLKENTEIAKASYCSPKVNRNKICQCNSILCVITEYDQDPISAVCIECKHEYHTFCDGRSSSEEIDFVYAYTCLKCESNIQSPNDLITMLSQRGDSTLTEEDDIKLQSVQVKTSLDELKHRFLNIKGPREKALDEYLKMIHVSRETYFGGTFVGNMCIKILEHYSTICEFMEGSDQKETLQELFRIFSALQPLLYANRFLSDQEISLICSLCDEFGTCYPKNLPKENISRKVHELICTVPRFVKKHRSIGLFSEQSSESLHSAVKMEARSLAALPSKTEQLRLQFIRQELRTNTDKSLAKRESRLCQNSHDGIRKSFLRRGNDGDTHCKICQPLYFM